MAYGPSTKVRLTSDWQEIASGVANIMVSLDDVWSARVFVGSAAPAIGSDAGHLVTARQPFAASGLTTEKIYARAARTDTHVAVTKG